jgi:HMW1 domain 2/HMW1C N-terminal
MTDRRSLPALERLVAAHRLPEALDTALRILAAVDSRAGRIDGVVAGPSYPDGGEEDVALTFATRFAAVFGQLIITQGLKITATDYERLLSYYRWIDLIFSLSGFRTSDHLVRLIAKDAGGGRLSFQGTDYLRLLTVLTMNSFIHVDFDRFWRTNRVASAIAFFNYISSRYVFSRRAFEFRERLLEWMPERLAEVKFGAMTLARLPEVYMHCSYALTARKHAIKRPLMEQMRRACLEAGVIEAEGAIPPHGAGRATVVVVGERFAAGHAVFRSHSRAVRALRARFHVVGAVHPNPTSALFADYFDECIAFPTGDFFASVRAVAAAIAAHRPALILYLGVGMTAAVIALASLRLAPIQCASYGHTATTMSPVIDYFILPEDFVGSAECFSEAVLAVPQAAMPFAPRPVPPAVRRPADGTVRVAIPASTMKLNPLLFDALASIVAGARSRVAFQFFPLAATGLPYFELSRIVRAAIPQATVFPEAPHERYMERLAECDLFLCPFPYGNMNSIIDAFQLGLPGVCLDGIEAHAHADAAFFARIALPAELIAGSVDDYVAAAVKLIDDEAWRAHCTDIVRRADLDAAFFGGDTGLFAAAIENLIWPDSDQYRLSE